MLLEQVLSGFAIALNVIGLMICLFDYIKRPTKTAVFAIVYLLSTLLSNYYWGVYVAVMDDYPNVSSFLSYVGWNAAFLVLTILLIFLMTKDRIRYFNPLCLIPIPLNIVQLFMYLQYGGYFNNIWQVVLSTFISCASINLILRYIFKHKKIENLRKPYIECVLLAMMFFEYVSWTASCFSWPTEAIDPYTYATILCSIGYIILPLSVIKTYYTGKVEIDESRKASRNIFVMMYVIFITTTCIGGCLLAVWMRDTLNNGIGQLGDKDPFSVIAVMLFVVSVVIILFTATIILVVSSDQKSYESRKLRIEKKDAEKSNAAKSEFLANMSHEIRTPINAVLGMNEMILRESLEARDMLPEEREEIIKIFSDICNYSGNIESAGNNLLSIINDILDFSKIEAGKMEITDGNYKLSSVLNDVSNMISFKAKSKGIEYIVDVDETLPDGLYGDEIRVRQIITNLLNNAVKYTQKGTIWLSVNERKGEEDKSTNLIVKVKDTGIGIKKEDISKLFRKFERVDMQNNSTVEGTGLGLAITGSLLDMMGGEISVESEYGKGSEFTVSIPQKIVSEEPIGNFREKFEKSISELKAPKENFHAPNASILIVDDTVMNLTVARGLLKKTRVIIDTAMSGEESIELAKEKAYDLILMDQRMPGMDGITAMHHIKEDGNGLNAGTPVICLTADAVSGAREKYLAEGFEDYITKPIDSRALLDALLKYLPKDKIKIVETKQVEKPVEAVCENSFESKLIDKKVGLGYCNGDKEFYETLLSEYVSESKDKAHLIKETYENKDWNNYGIYVHSLKSTSKMIGATELSEIAAELEAAAGKEDVATIDAKQDKMCGLYEDVLKEITDKFGIKQTDNSNEDIMEFMPE
ncbi:MAG: response regulator [Lachnospiraceae bacterium]|nr:response regulator [Lachnospiraceae bacterium]